MKPSKEVYVAIKIKIFNELFAFIESLYLNTAIPYSLLQISFRVALSNSSIPPTEEELPDDLGQNKKVSRTIPLTFETLVFNG